MHESLGKKLRSFRELFADVCREAALNRAGPEAGRGNEGFGKQFSVDLDRRLNKVVNDDIYLSRPQFKRFEREVFDKWVSPDRLTALRAAFQRYRDDVEAYRKLRSGLKTKPSKGDAIKRVDEALPRGVGHQHLCDRDTMAYALELLVNEPRTEGRLEDATTFAFNLIVVAEVVGKGLTEEGSGELALMVCDQWLMPAYQAGNRAALAHIMKTLGRGFSAQQNLKARVLGLMAEHFHADLDGVEGADRHKHAFAAETVLANNCVKELSDIQRLSIAHNAAKGRSELGHHNPTCLVDGSTVSVPELAQRYVDAGYPEAAALAETTVASDAIARKNADEIDAALDRARAHCRGRDAWRTVHGAVFEKRGDAAVALGRDRFEAQHWYALSREHYAESGCAHRTYRLDLKTSHLAA